MHCTQWSRLRMKISFFYFNLWPEVFTKNIDLHIANSGPDNLTRVVYLSLSLKSKRSETQLNTGRFQIDPNWATPSKPENTSENYYSKCKWFTAWAQSRQKANRSTSWLVGINFLDIYETYSWKIATVTKHRQPWRYKFHKIKFNQTVIGWSNTTCTAVRT